MKPLLTADEAAALDRSTQERGVAAATLMERAGRAVARAALDLAGGAYGRRALVVVGKGNNGGDGLVAARHLARWGMGVTALLLAEDGLRGPASEHHRRLVAETRAGVRPFSVAVCERELGRVDVVIDAVFGTGFRGAPDDTWAHAIDCLERGAVPVIAVDIASGVDATTGAVEGAAVHADMTVAFGAAKVGSLVMPGAAYAGDVRVVDIGFADGAIEATTFVVEPADIRSWIPARPIDTHKRAAGVVVVVAGSRVYTGAPVLVAQAAARIGAGLVVVAAPFSALPAVQAAMPEAVYVPLEETPEGTVAPESLPAVIDALGRAHALAVGPGLTTGEDAASFVRSLVRSSPVPVVVDADALTAFTGRASDLAQRQADAVLTPHLGEFIRVADDVTPDDVSRDRLSHARDLASTAQAVTLLKGPRTAIVEPDGRVAINITGGPVLATAGSGDVLTGAIGGLLARGLGAFEAACAGAYVHGLAGTLAGFPAEPGVTATDVADHLGPALDRIGGT